MDIVPTWRLNMFSLIGLGTGAAWLFSVIALLWPAAALRLKMNGGAPLYFEAAAVITTLVLGSRSGLRARSRTNTAVRSC
jgi:cation transport ATPase